MPKQCFCTKLLHHLNGCKWCSPVEILIFKSFIQLLFICLNLKIFYTQRANIFIDHSRTTYITKQNVTGVIITLRYAVPQ